MAQPTDDPSPVTGEKSIMPAAGSKERECPVPKPRGFIGRILGFKEEDPRDTPVVRIETSRRDGCKEEETR